MTSGQPLSLASLRAALSADRVNAYRQDGDADDLDAVARYLWNSALAIALQPALHAVEVTFRNHLYASSLKVVDASVLRVKDVPCWLDADPSLLYEKEERAVEEAKQLLRRGSKEMTVGRLISKLGFGFWCCLCRRPYEQGRSAGPGLWPGLLKAGFPFLPRDHRTRPQIQHRFDEIREVRNRVSHHEPIWDRNIGRTHGRIVAALGWMNQGVAAAVQQVCTVDEVAERGVGGFREMAEQLVRQ